MTTAIIPYEAPEMTWEDQCLHIIAELASGRSVSSILRDDEGMPAARKFWSRLYRDPDLFEKISRAREFGQEACMEKALDIASTPMIGQEVTMEVGPDGAKRKVVEKDMLGHRRLLVDTYVRRAQMIAPRKYGPKLDLTSDGEGLASIAERVRAGNKRLEERKGD